MSEYEQLQTTADRAAYLLRAGVKARTLPDGRYEAHADGITLPVTGASESRAIKRATEWLKTKCGLPQRSEGKSTRANC